MVEFIMQRWFCVVSHLFCCSSRKRHDLKSATFVFPRYFHSFTCFIILSHKVAALLSRSIGRLFTVIGFCGVAFVFIFLFLDNSLPFIIDEFTLRISMELLLSCSVIDRYKSMSFGSSNVLFSFNSGDFSLVAILPSWIVLLMLFQKGSFTILVF